MAEERQTAKLLSIQSCRRNIAPPPPKPPRRPTGAGGGRGASRSAKAVSTDHLHPTVKPVALVTEAIKDCSRRSEAVLDPFGGSGTTLIAAEKAGRRARLVEFDTAYCDQIVRRFELVTGKQAKLAASGQSFEAVAEERGSSLQAATSKE